MRILFINHTIGIGSTGRICTDLAAAYEKEGHECKIAYGRGACAERFERYAVRIGSDLSLYANVVKARIFDNDGLSAKRATRRFLEWARAYDPDVLWLHNLHGYYINYEMLFAFIKSRPQMKVKWTLHDCWSFTGHCACFTMADCRQWETHCTHCVQKGEYPASRVMDGCKRNFERKRASFTGVSSMELVTPSKWLADLTKKSFLREYPVTVVHNKIDLDIFKPTEGDFRSLYGVEGKTLLLGVANAWQKSKGLYDFLSLARVLGDGYAIALVGLTEKQIEEVCRLMPQMKKAASPSERATVLVHTDACATDEERAFCERAAQTDPKPIYRALGAAIEVSPFALAKQIMGESCTAQGAVAKLILMQRTDTPTELAALYTAADLFLNPTYEDNYPTTNLEAQACGTTVITYKTGGCVETLDPIKEDITERETV